MAQGAFNYGKVKTTTGQEQQFDQTRMAKFRHDGSDFDITSQGPCNIWGLALTAEGEAWIQEANDYGYPVMPFHEYANYPGCSDAQFKSYAPEFPGTATDFAMGGTGLSGLALSDKTGWPEPYAAVMYVANPITRKIQAIRITRHEEHDGWRYRYQKLPDFVQSGDEWFRPVALRLGPDGCLASAQAKRPPTEPTPAIVHRSPLVGSGGSGRLARVPSNGPLPRLLLYP
jgi:hypothetical protein